MSATDVSLSDKEIAMVSAVFRSGGLQISSLSKQDWKKIANDLGIKGDGPRNAKYTFDGAIAKLVGAKSGKVKKGAVSAQKTKNAGGEVKGAVGGDEEMEVDVKDEEGGAPQKTGRGKAKD